VKAITTALEELFGLFVEDSSLAVLILVWVAIVAVVLPRVPGGGSWKPILFFGGLLLILLENVRRSARKP
jgi:hypothetical protein